MNTPFISARFEYEAYENRPARFKEVERKRWEDWRWQQQNTLKKADQLQSFFPDISSQQVEVAKEWEKRGFRFSLTPYVLSMVEKDTQGSPVFSDPIWRQFFPAFEGLLNNESFKTPDEYSPGEENWELDGEMLSPISQRKYDNRMLIFTTDICLSYCGYCLRSLQVEGEHERHGGQSHWQKALSAIRGNPDVEEVILSGGDPLAIDNRRLEKMLKEIREIPSVKSIRINTRVFTHNPYRIDKELCDLLQKYAVTVLAVHTAHPNEITKNFHNAVELVRASGARTMLLAQIPLIKNVNDNSETLRGFFMDLFTSGIKPYYLLHMMPNIPAASSQRTSVRQGVDIMNQIGRRISHPAMPEYIIVHETGKRTVPIEPGGTPEFRYESDTSGHPIIRFKNWKGSWETYIDSFETPERPTLTTGEQALPQRRPK